jgi:hypothetical protein
MIFLNLENIKNKFHELNSFKIFILSFLICLLFYAVEGLIGIDRFYHPDSTYYLSNPYHNKDRIFDLKNYLNNPLMIFKINYSIITNLFGYNYYLLIILNFIIYSTTNIFIYQKVFKKYFNKLNNLKLFFLFYLLFLDPYRLHLASHILKETFLIFFMMIIILSNIKIIKIISIVFLEAIRPKAYMYILIFITYFQIKKYFKKKTIIIIFISLILILITFFLLDQNIYSLAQIEYEKFINEMKKYYNRIMPLRSYDDITLFKEFGFPKGFILKNISWPLMLVSGFFIFFVSSFLFKFLGIIIILNNILIFIITKKTYISLGLVIILVLISVYSSSYTAYFRYSYIALYSSVIYFFFNLDLKNKN